MRRQTLAFTYEGIQLSKREVATLQAASRIAEQARELAREIDDDFEDHWLDCELAGIEHPINQSFAEGWLPVTESEGGSPFRF